MSMMRAAGVAGVLVAVSVSLCGCDSSQGTADAPDSTASPHGGLSNQEYAAAVELARQEIDREAATVTSATATVGSGKVQNPNLAGRCDSGR